MLSYLGTATDLLDGIGWYNSPVSSFIHVSCLGISNKYIYMYLYANHLCKNHVHLCLTLNSKLRVCVWAYLRLALPDISLDIPEYPDQSGKSHMYTCILPVIQLWKLIHAIWYMGLNETCFPGPSPYLFSKIIPGRAVHMQLGVFSQEELSLL